MIARKLICAVSVLSIHIGESTVCVAVNLAALGIAGDLDRYGLFGLILNAVVRKVDVVHSNDLLAVSRESGICAVIVGSACYNVDRKSSIGVVDVDSNACIGIYNIYIRRLSCGLLGCGLLGCGLFTMDTENLGNISRSRDLCCAVCDERTGDILGCLNIIAVSLYKVCVISHILVVNILRSYAESLADSHIVIILEKRVVNGVYKITLKRV